jgi:hypothetical protein
MADWSGSLAGLVFSSAATVGIIKATLDDWSMALVGEYTDAQPDAIDIEATPYLLHIDPNPYTLTITAT